MTRPRMKGAAAAAASAPAVPSGGAVWFVAADRGPWTITAVEAVTGPGLPDAARLNATTSDPGSGCAWTLTGATSELRYTMRVEQDELVRRSPPLGRAEARQAALIPIRKSAAWWELAQDERRHLLEERSRHISTGLRHLPTVARRLYHSRHLDQPFTS